MSGRSPHWGAPAGPMPGARHQNLLSPAQHSLLQAVECLPIHGDYRVELACYEERGLANLELR
jgi:hypothetical protein